MYQHICVEERSLCSNIQAYKPMYSLYWLDKTIETCFALFHALRFYRKALHENLIFYRKL